MIGLAFDENFNNDVIRGLLRRNPALDVVWVWGSGRGKSAICLCVEGPRESPHGGMVSRNTRSRRCGFSPSSATANKANVANTANTANGAFALTPPNVRKLSHVNGIQSETI